MRGLLSFVARRYLSASNGSSRDAQEAGRKAAAVAQSIMSQQPELLSTARSTDLAHAGIDHGSSNAPMAPPLHLATTYVRPPGGPYEKDDQIYTREDNPTRLALERAVEVMECQDGCASFAFSSGMAAVSSIILAHELPLHVVLIPHDLYHGVPAVLETVFARFAVQVHSIANVTKCEDELQQILDSIPVSENVIVWMESPSNPLLRILDLPRICHICQQNEHRLAVTTVVDSTVAPLQRPLALGADISMHSATKYLAGHSDVLAGVATVHPRKNDLRDRLSIVQKAAGSVASPLDSWLTLRGMRTLDVRFQKASQTTLQLANWFSQQQQKGLVTAVHYHGLPTHPQHILAQSLLQLVADRREPKQAKNEALVFGGMLSIEFANEIHATAFCGALLVAQRATSLGGTETLVEHRASIEPDHRRTSPPGLVRISVGLEHYHDLCADFERALGIVRTVCS